MASPRLLHTVLGYWRPSPPSMSQALVTTTTLVKCSCLRQRFTVQMVRAPNPLRAYVTKTPHAQKSFVKITKREPREIFNNILEAGKLKWQLTRRIRDETIQGARRLKNIQGLLWQVGGIFRMTPVRYTGGAVSIAAIYTYWYHRRHRQKLPLNGRMAFNPMTDEEAYRRSSEISDYIVRNIDHVETRVDHGGLPLDDQTVRVDRIMDRLRNHNYELDRFLMPGASWRPIVVADNADLAYKVAVTFSCGDVLLAGDVIRQLDDDHLGFILAHEMTHTVQRHETEWHANNIFWYQFLSVVLKPLKNYVVDFDIATYIGYFAQKIPVFDQRKCEMEADEFGFKFACSACYDYRKFGEGLSKVRDIVKRQKDRVAVPSYLHAQPEIDPNMPFDDAILFELQKSTLWANPKHPKMAGRIMMLNSAYWADKAIKFRRKKKCPALPNTPPTGAVMQSSGRPGQQRPEHLVNESQQNLSGQSKDNLENESQKDLANHSQENIQDQDRIDNLVNLNKDKPENQCQDNLENQSQENLVNQSQKNLTKLNQDVIDIKHSIIQSQDNAPDISCENLTSPKRENLTNLSQQKFTQMSPEKPVSDPLKK